MCRASQSLKYILIIIWKLITNAAFDAAFLPSTHPNLLETNTTKYIQLEYEAETSSFI